MDESLGMKYIEKVANGNAGEFYFAYWISSNFIWPCRILDIDMGLDSQIEIYDDSNHSTGMFIGVQIKTTAKTLEESPSVSVPLKNIVYWESINDPIVIVRVCLNNNKEEPLMYWKHLSKDLLKGFLIGAKESNIENVTINFGDNKKALHKDDKLSWLNLFLSDEEKDLIERSEVIKGDLESLGQYFVQNSVDGQLTAGYPSYQFASELNDTLNSYDKLESAVAINPRLKYLSQEVDSAIKCYELYISVILAAFTEGFDCNSIVRSDIDTYSLVNPRLHRIMSGY